MPDQSIAQNQDFNNFMTQNMEGLDTAMKKYVKPDKEGAERLNKEADSIKEKADSIAFPQAPPPDKQNTDPLQVMGSAGGWIATLGSLLTRHPMTSALNASAGAINAAKQGDQNAYDASMQKWKEGNELIDKQLKWVDDQLKDAKDESELRVKAGAMGFPGVDTIFRQPEGAKNFMRLYDDNVKTWRESQKKGMDDLSVKMETAAYVRDKVEEARRNNPNATPEELHKVALQAQGEAKSLADKGNTPLTDDDEKGIDFRVGLAATGDPSAFQNISRGKAGDQIRNKMWEKLANQPGMTPEKLASLHLKFRSLGSEEGALGTQTAKLATSGEEFDRLADLAQESSERVDRTKYPSLNKAIEAVDAGTGDDNVVALVTNARGAVNTWARAINPNGVATVEATTAGTHLLDVAYSKGQFKEALKQMKNETKAARQAPAAVQKGIAEQINPTKKTPSEKHIKTLKADPSPENRQFFDDVYGEGASARALGK